MIEGFVTIAITFWLVIGIVFVANGYFVYQVRKARYRVMQTLAEKGQPVPLELFNGPRKSAPVGLLRGGIILVFIGVALMAFFWSMTSQSFFHGPIESASWLPTLGLFPLMIGLALLFMAMFERNRPQ
jgi:hypothetical protein